MSYNKHFTAAEMTSYRNAFRAADSDHSGKLDHKELQSLMAHSGEVVTFARVDEMMAEIDKNGDGFCDFEEVNHE
jgi:Ca2+-binding EF-hand superfamily protein